MKNKENFDLPYPLNLQADVVGEVTEDMERNPGILLASVEYILAFLKDQYRDAIHGRYRDRLTFKEVSERISPEQPSSEHGRRIVQHTLNWLKRVDNIDYIKYGIRHEKERAYDRGYSYGVEDAIRRLPLASLNLTTKTLGVFQMNGYKTVGGVLCIRDYLWLIKNIGAAETQKIEEVIFAMGGDLPFYLKEGREKWLSRNEGVSAKNQSAADPEDGAIPIGTLDLSVRAYNCLRRGNINTVKELSQKTPQDLLRIRNMGKGSVNEIVKKLRQLGIELKSESEET